MLRASFVSPRRKEGPPDIWDTPGISGNVFANPHASSTAPYPQELNQWNSSIEEPLHLSKVEKSERQKQDQDLRCQSGPSAKDSVIFSGRDSSKNYGADQQRLQISDLHFDKFPTPATFACWKIRFKTEVCTCSQFPTEAMQWIKEVEMVDSVDDLRSSSSTRGISMPNFEVLDARIASALNKIIHNSKIKIVQIIDHSMRLLSFVNRVRWRTSFTFVQQRVSPFFHVSESCFQELRRSDPIKQVREYHPTSILHPKKWYLTLLNCVKLKFVSYTSNLLEQMYDFQQCTMFLQKWISNLQDLPRSQSLETTPTCIVLQYYPHNNTVCNYTYDECKRSNEIIVCHRLWSILWSIVHVCSLTIECQVFQFVPGTNMSHNLCANLW